MLNASYKAICEEYAVWLDTLGFSHSIVYNYANSAKDFFQWLQANSIVTITSIKQKHLQDYFEHLQSRPNKRQRQQKALSTAHLNKSFAAVDKLAEFLQQMGATAAPIPTNFRIKPDKAARVENIKPLTQEEIKLLQSNIEKTYHHFDADTRRKRHEELKLIFALYYGCGLRRGEGHNLLAKDVDFERKTIFIRQGKNYKDRIVPMNPNVYKAVQDYLYGFRNQIRAGHDRLFISGTYTLNTSLQELQRASKLERERKKITLHLLRHSIATHLMQNGMTVESIALFLGHDSLESTQVYTHLSADLPTVLPAVTQ